MQEQVYTVQEVAQRLKVSEKTVRVWIDQGDLPAFNIGKRGYRIRESDLSAFIEKRMQQQRDNN